MKEQASLKTDLEMAVWSFILYMLRARASSWKLYMVIEIGQ